MGISSNEGDAMGYHVDANRACIDAREARQRGIGWHTSTHRYIELPSWFGPYMQALPDCYGLPNAPAPAFFPLR